MAYPTEDGLVLGPVVDELGRRARAAGVGRAGVEAVVEVLVEGDEAAAVVGLGVVALEGGVGQLDERLGLVDKVAQARHGELG